MKQKFRLWLRGVILWAMAAEEPVNLDPSYFDKLRAGG